jgi:hypothetical protein
MKQSYSDLISRLKDIASGSPLINMRAMGGFRITDRDYDLYRIDLAAPEPAPVRICITTGIHGDEPAGPEAVAQFLERNADNHALLRTFSFVIFPCDNPSGYAPFLRHHLESAQTTYAYLSA